MVMRRAPAAAIAALIACAAARAQPLDRLTGRVAIALMQRDVDAARRAFSDARALTKDQDERGYLANAIAELNKAHDVMRRTY